MCFFTNCISRINNTQVDDVSYTDVVMWIYNLREYSDNCLKTSEILWQFYKDVLAINADGTIIDFTEANAITEPFNLKEKLVGEIATMAQKMLKWYH